MAYGADLYFPGNVGIFKGYEDLDYTKYKPQYSVEAGGYVSPWRTALP
ncbi:MAG: hypothetical protein ACLU94_10305 [Catenibacillus sp.]